MKKARLQKLSLFVVQNVVPNVQFIGKLLEKVVLYKVLSLADQLPHRNLRVLEIEVDATAREHKVVGGYGTKRVN